MTTTTRNEIMKRNQEHADRVNQQIADEIIDVLHRGNNRLASAHEILALVSRHLDSCSRNGWPLR